MYACNSFITLSYSGSTSVGVSIYSLLSWFLFPSLYLCISTCGPLHCFDICDCIRGDRRENLLSHMCGNSHSSKNDTNGQYRIKVVCYSKTKHWIGFKLGWRHLHSVYKKYTHTQHTQKNYANQSVFPNTVAYVCVVTRSSVIKKYICQNA